MFPVLKKEEGMTLVSVMLMLLMITILGAGLMSSAIMENKIVYSVEDQRQAYYLAQAGIEYARYQLQQDLTWRIEDYTATVGQGNFTLDVLDDGENQLKLISLGTVGQRSQRLEVGIFYTLPGTGNRAIEQLAQYTALGGGNITFKNSATVIGDLRTNGDVEFQKNIVLDGEVIAGGQVSGGDAGQVTEDADTYQLPVIDWEALRAEAEANGRYYTDWNTNLLDDAVNYIDGDVSENKVELILDGVLVIRGDLEIKNDSLISGADGLMIFVDGNVTFKNKMNLNAAIYATGSIQVQNNAEITGAIYAEESIEIKNNVQLTLEASHLQQTIVESFVTEREDGGTSEETEKSMSLTYWKET